MLRNEFLRNSTLLAAGCIINPFKILGQTHPNNFYAGPALLIDTLSTNAIKQTFENYKVSDNRTSTELVETYIKLKIAEDDPDGRRLKIYDEHTFKPLKNTQALTGTGQGGKDPNLAAIPGKASTPIHLILPSRNARIPINLSNYCDPRIMQTFDEDACVYVKPLTNTNPHGLVYYVDRQLDYILYNPLYWCKGLPIQNPQIHTVSPEFQREIYNSNKVFKTCSLKTYKTQRFVYSGIPCNGPEAKSVETDVWYDYDSAIHEYYKLAPIQPCGDPSKGCIPNQVIKGSIRTNVRS